MLVYKYLQAYFKLNNVKTKKFTTNKDKDKK